MDPLEKKMLKVFYSKIYLIHVLDVLVSGLLDMVLHMETLIIKLIMVKDQEDSLVLMQVIMQVLNLDTMTMIII